MTKRKTPFFFTFKGLSNLPIFQYLNFSLHRHFKERSIQDGVRTVEDILEFAKLTDCSGILLAIDFEKAFDSLNRSFLFKVLKKFNFGPYFLEWIKTFYSNISSCVLNKHFYHRFISSQGWG